MLGNGEFGGSWEFAAFPRRYLLGNGRSYCFVHRGISPIYRELLVAVQASLAGNNCTCCDVDGARYCLPLAHAVCTKAP